MGPSWQKLKVGDFLTLEYGKPLEKEKRKDNGLYPAYGANGIKCRSDEYFFDKKTIIVGRKGSAGEITLTEDKFWPLDVTYFVKFDDSLYDLMFVYHLLSLLDLPGLATGVKPGINRNNVYAIEVWVPDLPEQKRIVAILDQAFAAIDRARELTERNLHNARELFESYLQQVSDFSQPLGRFVSIKTGKLNANAAVEGGQYPFFTCSREVFGIDQYSFDCEAILLAGNNASGDFNVKHYKGKFDAYQRTYVLTINDESQLHYSFLHYQMIKSLKELKESSVGAATKFLKLDMINSLMISVPPIEKQNEVLEVLLVLKSKADALTVLYQKKLEALDELKKSLLQKAFNGELGLKSCA